VLSVLTATVHVILKTSLTETYARFVQLRSRINMEGILITSTWRSGSFEALLLGLREVPDLGKNSVPKFYKPRNIE